MKRVLYASWYTGLGGGETDLLNLAGALDQRRYQPHLLLPSEGALAERWRGRGWAAHIVPFRGASTWFAPGLWARFPVVKRLENLLRQANIDLVHSDYHALPLIAPAAERLGIPLLWTLWGWWFQPKPWQRAFFRRRQAVARSQAIRAGFLGDPPFMRAERLPVIYAGIDTERFQPASGRALRREIGIADEVPVVALVARFQPVKGHHTFQAMAEKVLARKPETRFIIAGADVFGMSADARYRDEILARARSHEILRESLLYIGFRHDVERVYAAADVYVCPSDFESYGVANLEAMACGLPVVSTNQGGPAETIAHGETGFLVPSGDADSLADGALRLLDDAALRHSMGRAGRRRVQARFSLEASVAAHSRLYEKMLGLN